MATVDLLPAPTNFLIGADNDKIITAGPFTRGGVVVSRVGKRLRFVLKATAATLDADALLDLDSVADPLAVYGTGADSTGLWVIDIRDLLPAAGSYWFRVDLTAVASLSVDREIAGRGSLRVKPV